MVTYHSDNKKLSLMNKIKNKEVDMAEGDQSIVRKIYD